MLKKDTKVINKKGLNYVIGTDGKPLRIKPWLGESFSFLYDFIMRKAIRITSYNVCYTKLLRFPPGRYSIFD